MVTGRPPSSASTRAPSPANGKSRRAARMRAKGKRLPCLLPFGEQYLQNRVQYVHIDDVARLIALYPAPGTRSRGNYYPQCCRARRSAHHSPLHRALGLQGHSCSRSVGLQAGAPARMAIRYFRDSSRDHALYDGAMHYDNRPASGVPRQRVRSGDAIQRGRGICGKSGGCCARPSRSPTRSRVTDCFSLPSRRRLNDARSARSTNDTYADRAWALRCLIGFGLGASLLDCGSLLSGVSAVAMILTTVAIWSKICFSSWIAGSDCSGAGSGVLRLFIPSSV